MDQAPTVEHRQPVRQVLIAIAREALGNGGGILRRLLNPQPAKVPPSAALQVVNRMNAEMRRRALGPQRRLGPRLARPPIVVAARARAAARQAVEQRHERPHPLVIAIGLGVFEQALDDQAVIARVDRPVQILEQQLPRPRTKILLPAIDQ